MSSPGLQPEQWAVPLALGSSPLPHPDENRVGQTTLKAAEVQAVQERMGVRLTL